MNSTFVFNGRSRPTQLFLSRDHQPSRETILSDARLKRERRERDRQLHQAAVRVQRNVRMWLGRKQLADIAADLFQMIVKESKERPEDRSLEQLCCYYKFVIRGRRHGFASSNFLEVSRIVILQQLHRSIHGGILKEELSKSSWWLDLLVELVLEEYLSRMMREEVDALQSKEDQLLLFSALLDATSAAAGMKGTERILLLVLRFLVQHGTVGNEEILSFLRSLFAKVSGSSVRNTMATKEGRETLILAIKSSVHDESYAPPTKHALDVLVGFTSAGDISSVNEEANMALIEAIIGVSMDHLHTELRIQPMAALGKLVRLTPVFFFSGESLTIEREYLRKWLTCVSQLLSLADRKKEFIRTSLQDLRHLNGTDSSHLGKYKHSSTYLFSAECGLRLLEEGAAAVLSVMEWGDGGCGPMSSSLLESFSDFDLLCSIFAWPLYNLTHGSAEQRIEATTIFSKLVHLPGLLRRLWCVYQSCHMSAFGGLMSGDRAALLRQVADGVLVHLNHAREPPAELLSKVPASVSARTLFWDPYPAISTLLFGLLSYFVDATDFVDGLCRRTVMDRDEAVILVLSLKGIVYRSHFHGILPYGNNGAVAQSALTLLVKLYVINEARVFVSHPSTWIATNDPIILATFDTITRDAWMSFALAATAHDTEDSENSENDNEDKEENYDDATLFCRSAPHWDGSSTWTPQERSIRILQNAPFTISFNVRAAVFTHFLLGRENPLFGTNRPFLVHRGHAFADAFERFSDTPGTSEMLSVRFLDANNTIEEGYGEGVYREFLVTLCTEGFAAEHGLFRQTDDGYVYPNPFSYEVTGDPQHLHRITFLGAMVGRALRDGVLLDIPFALHFRNTILGRSNSINNLKSFDEQLYRHLISLSSLTEEEIESLSLNFTYTVDILGEAREVELLRGGRAIPVTHQNCMNYIHLLADFKLNRESARQTKAFQTGLELIVDRSWLRLFDSREIMKIFGGDAECSIDVADWRKHTQYHDANDEKSIPVSLFWEVVECMSPDQRKKLLKFATSMNRPPLLGFQFLNPPFKVHITWGAPEDRLPSASTCFSTMNMPPYRDMETAWRKIISAIEEAEHFCLT